jgi:hypothetical protein
MWPFNTGDCLIEVTALAGMTVCVIFCIRKKAVTNGSNFNIMRTI